MKSHAIYTAAMTIALATCLAQHASALDKSPVLSLDLAKKIAAGCEAKAKEMGWKMNISVVDGGANEIFFERMDGAYLGSGDIARYKAETSARFPFPTRGIEQLAYGKDLKGGTVPGLARYPASLPLLAACRS
jgi:glc operon protein GlcG